MLPLPTDCAKLLSDKPKPSPSLQRKNRPMMSLVIFSDSIISLAVIDDEVT